MIDAPKIETDAQRLIVDTVLYLAQLRSVDMSPGVVQFKIDGLTYTSQKLPTSVGLGLLPRVTALLGSAALGAAVTGNTEGMHAVETLLMVSHRAMAGEGLAPIVGALLQRTQCDRQRSTGKGGFVGTEGDFEEHFAGEYAHLLKVCLFVLSHNFRGPTYGGRSRSGPPVPSPYLNDTSESDSPTSTP